MIINREMDYALRILRQLNENELVTAAEIEEKEDVTTDFARKIMRQLKKAGIVEILRGAHGGYRLAVPCDRLTMWDVKQAIHPEPMVNKCMEGDFECTGSCGRNCRVNQECKRIESLLEEEMKKKNLKEIFGTNY